MLASGLLISTGQSSGKLFGVDYLEKKNVLKYKNYTHFDLRKSPKHYFYKVKNPCWVLKHGFYPFIHYKIKFTKYITTFINGEPCKEKKPKDRDIYYSSHIDRYIYQYYADLLNTKYNKYAKSRGINKCVIAYRKGFKGKNNIHYAKDVFDFIAQKERAIIVVGDFKHFFDNLNHEYLKRTINLVQGTEQLENDEYKVFKSITNYSYINFEDIESYKGMKRKEMFNLNKYFNTQEFQEFKRGHLHKHKQIFGIPQGSPISAVYSNCYMIEFDDRINSFITGIGGLYRRYCDDFIIVFPYNCDDEIEERREFLMGLLTDNISDTPNLILHPDKTTILSYKFDTDEKFEQIDGYGRILDYLGFSFDGVEVKLREKSLFKFYSRAYKKVSIINKNVGKDYYYSMKKSLYRLYTHLGDKKYSSQHGNFITYGRKAHEIMSSSEVLESKINQQYKRHWNKIIKRID